MKREFTIQVRVRDESDTQHTYTGVLEFDADDIYDAALAAEVRAFARAAEVRAHLRDTSNLVD